MNYIFPFEVLNVLRKTKTLLSSKLFRFSTGKPMLQNAFSQNKQIIMDSVKDHITTLF